MLLTSCYRCGRILGWRLNGLEEAWMVEEQSRVESGSSSEKSRKVDSLTRAKRDKGGLKKEPRQNGVR